MGFRFSGFSTNFSNFFSNLKLLEFLIFFKFDFFLILKFV
jgi:hypothetical protein